MQDYFFYLFFALALISAVLVVSNRNPVNGAMFMILTLLSIAGMFALLEAYLLAILQVLVYAGAIMVLFLFIIMLIDVQGTVKRSTSSKAILAAVISGLLMVGGIWLLFEDNPGALEQLQKEEVAEVALNGNPFEYATGPEAFGWGLFTKYMLPVQVTGFLLLIAMIGVIIISKRMKPSEEGHTPSRKVGL